jgi:hypothetical protein
MTRRAGTGDLVLVGHGRRDEAESVGMHRRPRNALRFDGWHVAGNTIAAGASILVTCVLLERGRTRTIGPRRRRTIQADLIRRLSQLSVVFRAVRIVARGTGNSMPLHHAPRKVVALHAVLMRGAVRKVLEAGFAQPTILEFREILQP